MGVAGVTEQSQRREQQRKWVLEKKRDSSQPRFANRDCAIGELWILLSFLYPCWLVFRSPNAFPAQNHYSPRFSQLLGKKTKGSSRVDTASSLQNTFLARLSCLLILNLWWFARSRASILQHEIFPRAQRFSSCPPPVFCAERMETLALVRYLAHLYDFSFRELQTLRK